MSVQSVSSDVRSWSFYGVHNLSLLPVTACEVPACLKPATIDFELEVPDGTVEVNNIILSLYVDMSWRGTVADGSKLSENGGAHPGTACHDTANSLRCFVPDPKWTMGSPASCGTFIPQRLTLHVVDAQGIESDPIAVFADRVPQSVKLRSHPGMSFGGGSASSNGRLIVRLKAAGDVRSLIINKLTADAHTAEPVPAPAPVKAKRSGAKGGK